MPQRIDWDAYFFSLCYLTSMRSPDPSTKLGAVIVSPDKRIVAAGYNGWPRGVADFADDDPRWQRPEKYHWMAHAERNAVDNAAVAGVPLQGCDLYTIIMPCADCARGIVQVGIKTVYYHAQAWARFMEGHPSRDSWTSSMTATMAMFKEAGVELVEWSGRIPMLEGWVNSEPFDLYPEIGNSALKTFKKLSAVGSVKADSIKHPPTE